MLKYFLLLFVTTNLYSQSFIFNVKDINQNQVQIFNVLFAENSTNLMGEFTKITPASKMYKLKKKYQNLQIEIQCYGFISEKILIQNIHIDSI